MGFVPEKIAFCDFEDKNLQTRSMFSFFVSKLNHYKVFSIRDSRKK